MTFFKNFQPNSLPTGKSFQSNATKFPHPGLHIAVNQKAEPKKGTIKIVSPPLGEQDQSNALPQGQQRQSNPHPMPCPPRRLYIDRCIRMVFKSRDTFLNRFNFPTFVRCKAKLLEILTRPSRTNFWLSKT